jgi:hypothetical protein
MSNENGSKMERGELSYDDREKVLENIGEGIGIIHRGVPMSGSNPEARANLLNKLGGELGNECDAAMAEGRIPDPIEIAKRILRENGFSVE